MASYDVVVIGGGYYGCFLAYQVAAWYPRKSVAVLERADALFTRASGTNQGQLHQGYMYSADVALAAECVRNHALFTEHFPDAVGNQVVSCFGVHRDSEISAGDYRAFCADLGLPLPAASMRYFGGDVVAAFQTAERTFDNARLAAIITGRLAGVDVRLSHGVNRVVPRGDGSHDLVMADGTVITAGIVFNAAFADINPLHDRSSFPRVPMRAELFLHFLVGLPDVYRNLGLTVIRGQFASLLPCRSGHLLAAAAFRRLETSDSVSLSEHVDLRRVSKTHAEAVRECARYLPVLNEAVYRGHVVGTRVAFIDVLTGETTSRVTPLVDFGGVAGYHVVLGGKVPCLFEALEPVLAVVRR
nr:FAD-dependent oxidoreductase [Kibdelosporangium sp. MJ126-NF4]CTQ91492.1 D amino acid oxidase (DAO) family (EC 1.4.3.3) [Kibdelosporangium sp. MJ126-NF4]